MVLRTTNTMSNEISDFNFEDLLNQFDYAEPERGQILEGTILSIDRDEIILDVGLKRDAVVGRKDLMRLDGSLIDDLEPGQSIKIYVLQPYNEEGDLVVSINKALQQEDWSQASELMDNETIIQATVIDQNRGGVLVKFGRLMGFVPNSHLESVPTMNNNSPQLYEAKSGLIGKTLNVKVIQVEMKRNRLVLSERAAQQATRQERLSELSQGDILEGRVVNLTDFGAFIDLGGVDGMIHISNIDHRHVNHPSDVLNIGDKVTVRIDSIDVERERIALNRKAILPDPWQSFIDKYDLGDLLVGVVTNVVDFGVFVAAEAGAQGLLHTSRMTSLGASHPRDMFREGDEVLVRIVGIDTDQQHIELSIDDVTTQEQENWMYKRREDTPDAPETAEIVEESVDAQQFEVE